MKKTVLTLIAILIAVSAALAVLGRGGEYAAERLLYQAIKTQGKIADNPDVAPPHLLAAVQRDLEKVITAYPDTGSAKRAHIKFVEFYLFTKEYDKAVSETDTILKRYADDPVASSIAYFFKGTIYEKQGRWDAALKEFDIVKNKYTSTQLGMEAPLYIARHYRKKGESAETAKAYDAAARFYQEVERDNSGTMLGYVAASVLFQTYMEMSEYEKAGDALTDALGTYASPLAYTKLLPYVEHLFIEKLNRPEKAIDLYTQIQAKTKDEKFKQFLAQRINIIRSKNDNVNR